MGPMQRHLSETIDICDFRVAHDNGSRDAGVAAADDNDNGDHGAVFDKKKTLAMMTSKTEMSMPTKKATIAMGSVMW
jgi:hypothetical protein